MNPNEEARKIVKDLSVEDISDCITDYENRLIQLGHFAVGPLNEFLATESVPRESKLFACNENYEAARRVLEKIRGGIKMKNDIALVIVDAVAPDIEQYANLVKGNIQALTDRLKADSYELFSEFPNITGTTFTRQIDGNYGLNGTYNQVVLVGGSLGNRHYQAFASLLKDAAASGRAPRIHMPLDCTYAASNERFDGEAFSIAQTADPSMPIFQKYREALKQFAPAAYLIERDGAVTERSPVTQLKLWTEWKAMSQYLKQ